MQALGGQTLGVPQIILCTPSMGGSSQPTPVERYAGKKFNWVLLYSKITSILEKPQPLTENLKVTVGTLLMQKYGYFLIVHTKQENQS